MNHPIIRYVTESTSHGTNRPPLPLLSNTIGYKDATRKQMAIAGNEGANSAKEINSRGNIGSNNSCDWNAWNELLWMCRR